LLFRLIISICVAFMKLFNLLTLFAIALLFLFSLQGLWLYHTYHLQLKSIEESLNSIFYQTIEKELDQRFIELEKRVQENMLDSSIHVAFYNIESSNNVNNSIVSQQVEMVQHLMMKCNIINVSHPIEPH